MSEVNQANHWLFSEPTDWLWYYLKRLPANVALLRAIEARLLAAHAPAAPTLDCRDDDSADILIAAIQSERTFHSALFSASSFLPDPPALGQVNRLLRPNGTLFLSVPTSGGEGVAIENWNTLLNNAGFTIEQWQYFFSETAQFVYAKETSGWPNILHDLTGHYVLPWKSILTPVEQRLRPIYEETLPEMGAYALIVARKQASESIKSGLPQPTTIQLPTAIEASTENPEPIVRSAPVHTISAEPASPLFTQPILTAMFALVALASAFIAQGIFSSDISEPRTGVGWWLLGLVGLFGLSRVALPAANRANSGYLTAFQEFFSVPRLWRMALLFGALILSFLAASQGQRPFIGLPLWLIAIFLAFGVLRGPSLLPSPTNAREASVAPSTPSGYTRWLIWPILIFSLVLRYFQLTSHPFVLNGIETQLGLDAILVDNLFGTAWLTNPTLPLFLNKIPLAIFGRTPLGLRILSPIIGTATVAVVYLIGKRLWSINVGLLAALLLAGSHTHIHYSRLGMTNIWDPLLATIALGGIAVAWHQPKRQTWLLAAIAIGASAYVFTAAHLLPLMLVVILFLAILLHPQQIRTHWRHLAAATLLALIVALPQVLHYNSNRDLFMERANRLGILRNGWLDNEIARTGLPESALLGQQFWQASLGYNATIDRDSSYNPGVPLLTSIVSVFGLLGLGMAIFHVKQMRDAVWLVGLAITVIFGGMLLIEPPHSRRLLIALPFAIILAARAAVWFGEKITHVDGGLVRFKPFVAPALLTIGLLTALFNTAFYFGTYRNEARFGDRNTEIAHEVATYLASLDDGWTAYFHGAPSMYISFSTIPFLADNFESNVTLFDVTQPGIYPDTMSENVVHIFVPDRFGDISGIQSAEPGGTLNTISGQFSDPLYAIYELQNR